MRSPACLRLIEGTPQGRQTGVAFSLVTLFRNYVADAQNSIKKGEEVTVSDMFDRVTEQEFDTTKATINTNMANFVNNEVLVRVKPGVYKKA